MVDTISLENKTIRNKILSMILPITAENILQMTAGLVSMAMIGRVDPLAVGAIGISSILYRIIWAIFKGIATGASVFVAQSFGAKNYVKLKSVAEQALILSVGIAIILQQILYWNTKTLLLVFNPPPNLLANGELYLKIISWSLPFAAIILLVAGILQGMGNAKTPMFVIGILNIINIIFCYILISGKVGISSLGLKGAAYAYNIAYISSAILGLILTFGRKGIITELCGRIKLKFNFSQALAIFKYGLPTSFETAFWQASSIFLTRAILTYGEFAYSAYQLGLQAEAISYMPATGFGIAATAFIGQSLGSGDTELGKKYLNKLLKYTFIITIFAGGFLMLFPKQIMGRLTIDPDVISIGAMYLFVMGVTQMPQNISQVLNGALRGGGYARVPMINAGIGIWAIRVPFVLSIAFIFKADIIWIWIGIGLDMCFRLVFSYIYFKRKDIFENQKLVI